MSDQAASIRRRLRRSGGLRARRPQGFEEGGEVLVGLADHAALDGAAARIGGEEAGRLGGDVLEVFEDGGGCVKGEAVLFEDGDAAAGVQGGETASTKSPAS
jgi:hypothetical protein